MDLQELKTQVEYTANILDRMDKLYLMFGKDKVLQIAFHEIGDAIGRTFKERGLTPEQSEQELIPIIDNLKLIVREAMRR